MSRDCVSEMISLALEIDVAIPRAVVDCRDCSRPVGGPAISAELTRLAASDLVAASPILWNLSVKVSLVLRTFRVALESA